ncbi:M48 family metallopeptidase [Jannaschia sp. Os4]|uniref:M48 family metallopeptidase n=1 Tax=Jannaschia sp. Os4 TaxID=2807617 RepID=UPI0019397C95|nr:M48 family metallopeptidase [Jannaschia sp. Os4]MBM2575847.1 M48 family metallopeptidase [Jannaschia sp. Os4]
MTCTCHAPLSRRAVLTGALASPVVLAGCDGLPLLVSEAEAAQMGERAWADIRRQTPLSGDPGDRDLVGRIATRLLSAAGRDPRGWEIAVFRGGQVNAFALPGNKIGVYEGMIRLAGSEGELAAVIGHEIGHIDADHSRERMSATKAGNGVMHLIRWLLDWGEVQYAEEIVGALGVGVEFGVLRPYGRGQEEEADVMGVRHMAAAGYDPRDAISLWNRMDAAVQNRGPEFLSTHPAPRSRIEALEAAIAAV